MPKRIERFIYDMKIDREKAGNLLCAIVDLDHNCIDFDNLQFLSSCDWEEEYVLGLFYYFNDPCLVVSWNKNALDCVFDNFQKGFRI